MIDEIALTGNAADPDQVDAAAWLAKEREREQRARWRRQLSSKEGREFLWEEIFGGLQLFRWIASEDLQALGVRNKALEFWGFVNEHPDLFLQMQNEAIKRAKQRSDRTAAARTKRAAQQ